MKAEDAFTLATSPEAAARRQMAFDQTLQEGLGAVRQAALEGKFSQFLRVPREYASEFLTVFRSLGYVVTPAVDKLSNGVDVTISWTSAS